MALALLGAAGGALAQSELRSKSGLVYSQRTPVDGGGSPELWLLLHGQGDTHDNFMPLWAGLDCLANSVLVVPQAPRRTWRNDDVERVSQLLDEIIETHQPQRVYLAGYSRGGYLAYTLGLRERARLDGLLVSAAATESPRAAEEHDLPIYHIHGTLDQKVPFGAGQRSAQALRDAGYSMVNLRPLVNTNHILRDWAVTTGVWWLRARADLPGRDDDPAAILEAASAAREGKDDGRARVLAELVLRRAIGADVDELRDAAEKLLADLDTDAVKRSKQVARQIVKAKGKNRTWQPKEDLLRAMHPTPQVLVTLDDALAKLKGKHEDLAAPLLEKGLQSEAKADYRRAMSSWAKIQSECFLADACRIADQKINHYYTDPAIRKALGLR